jgi:hypothetical protein
MIHTALSSAKRAFYAGASAPLSRLAEGLERCLAGGVEAAPMTVQESPASRAAATASSQLLLGFGELLAGGDDPAEVQGIAGRDLARGRVC